ncbi:MAG: nitrite reductase (NAD(P)H) small subunit [Betaproteobacteria bacterium]
MSGPQWLSVCRVEDIALLGARRVARAQGAPVALFRRAEQGPDAVVALLDRCPHKGGPLSQGIVMGHGVACPLHNWTIGFDNGCAQAPDEGCTPRFALRIVDGAVQLDAQELASLGTELSLPVAGPCQPQA